MDYNVSEGIARQRKFIALKSTQIFLFAAIILMTLVITVLCIGLLVRYEVKSDVWNVNSVPYWNEKLTAEQRFWYDDGIMELQSALKVRWKSTKARNAVIIVAHNINAEALATARFTNGITQPKILSWEQFPHFGNILQTCNQTTPCDAFTYTTALYGGVPTKTGIGGFDVSVQHRNCAQILNEVHKIPSIIQMSQESGFRTGIVTTRRITGPSIASLYAHTPDTSWECDDAIPPGKQLQGCKDVGTQLIDDSTGNRLNVIMGGGRQTLVSNTPVTEWDPLDPLACKSKDGRNFIRDWRTSKSLLKERGSVLQNYSALRRLNGSYVDYVLGVFANGYIQPPWKRNSAENHMPELSNMVEKALEVLKRDEERFVLIVESGNESENDIERQIKEIQRLNETMARILKSVSEDTLITLIFMNEIFNDTAPVVNETSSTVSKYNTISTGSTIFANGPSSNLLQGLHVETYLAYAVSNALKIGQFKT